MTMNVLVLLNTNCLRIHVPETLAILNYNAYCDKCAMDNLPYTTKAVIIIQQLGSGVGGLAGGGASICLGL